LGALYSVSKMGKVSIAIEKEKKFDGRRDWMKK
jgi:hypothetical protein